MIPDLKIIKSLRKSAGITQKKLSKLTNLSQSYINKIENSISEPPYGVGKKIIELLKRLEIKNNNIDLKKIMTKIRTINYKKTLNDAIILMDKLNVSKLPVDDNKLIIGSISKSTIVKLLKNNIINLKEKRIETIMEPPYPMIPKDSPIKLIALLLEFNEAVLILNRGNFEGIISKRDLLKTIK